MPLIASCLRCRAERGAQSKLTQPLAALLVTVTHHPLMRLTASLPLSHPPHPPPPPPQKTTRRCMTSACVVPSLCPSCWTPWALRSRWRSPMTAKTQWSWGGWGTTLPAQQVRLHECVMFVGVDWSQRCGGFSPRAPGVVLERSKALQNLAVAVCAAPAAMNIISVPCAVLHSATSAAICPALLPHHTLLACLYSLPFFSFPLVSHTRSCVLRPLRHPASRGA